MFLCTGIIFTVLKAPFFNVKSIVCVGQEKLTEEEIIKAADAKCGVNIFVTNISAMKRRLSEMPEISESNVRRLFPNKLKIWVREAKGAGYVKVSGAFAVVDTKGKIIAAVPEKETDAVTGLAELTGLKVTSETPGQKITAEDDMKAEKIFECLDIMDRLGMLPHIRKTNAEDLSDIKLDYEGRLNIYIGSYDNMEYKLTFVKKVIDENISAYERADIDFRGEKLYVGPRESDTAAAETEAAQENGGGEEPQTQTGEKTENEEKQG